MKFDGDKHRPTLVLGSMSRALQAVIAVGEFGVKKYAVDNWLKVENGQQRYTDAMLRHLLAELGGEERDRDSGLLHAAHAAWGALARLELMLRIPKCAKGDPVFELLRKQYRQKMKVDPALEIDEVEFTYWCSRNGYRVEAL